MTEETYPYAELAAKLGYDTMEHSTDDAVMYSHKDNGLSLKIHKTGSGQVVADIFFNTDQRPLGVFGLPFPSARFPIYEKRVLAVKAKYDKPTSLLKETQDES